MTDKKLYVIKFGDKYFIGTNTVSNQLRKAKIYTSYKMCQSVAEELKKRHKYLNVIDYKRGESSYIDGEVSYEIKEVVLKEVD